MEAFSGPQRGAQRCVPYVRSCDRIGRQSSWIHNLHLHPVTLRPVPRFPKCNAPRLPCHSTSSLHCKTRSSFSGFHLLFLPPPFLPTVIKTTNESRHCWGIAPAENSGIASHWLDSDKKTAVPLGGHWRDGLLRVSVPLLTWLGPGHCKTLPGSLTSANPLHRQVGRGPEH